MDLVQIPQTVAQLTDRKVLWTGCPATVMSLSHNGTLVDDKSEGVTKFWNVASLCFFWKQLQNCLQPLNVLPYEMILVRY